MWGLIWLSLSSTLERLFPISQNILFKGQHSLLILCCCGAELGFLVLLTPQEKESEKGGVLGAAAVLLLHQKMHRRYERAHLPGKAGGTLFPFLLGRNQFLT